MMIYLFWKCIYFNKCIPRLGNKNVIKKIKTTQLEWYTRLFTIHTWYGMLIFIDSFNN